MFKKCPVDGPRPVDISSSNWANIYFGENFIFYTNQSALLQHKYIILPCNIWAQQAWPSFSCACFSLGLCNSSSCVSWHLHGDGVPNEGLILSGYCSRRVYVHLPTVYQQRSISVGLEGYLELKTDKFWSQN